MNNIYSDSNLESLIFDLLTYLYQTKDYEDHPLSNDIYIVSMNKSYAVSLERCNYHLGNVPLVIEENVKLEDYFPYYYPNTLALCMDSKLSEYLYHYDVPNCEEVADEITKIFRKHGFYYEFGSSWYLYAVPLDKKFGKFMSELEKDEKNYE